MFVDGVVIPEALIPIGSTALGAVARDFRFLMSGADLYPARDLLAVAVYGYVHSPRPPSRLQGRCSAFVPLVSRPPPPLFACRSRIRHQAAAGSWTMPRQREIQRTWLNSARAAVRSPAKPNGVQPSNDAWLRAAL